jgi:hypothetical protein
MAAVFQDIVDGSTPAAENSRHQAVACRLIPWFHPCPLPLLMIVEFSARD